jgi:hypothetical protein
MERRRAISVAAAISGALLVGALAITANADILGAPKNDKVGQLTPVVATPPTTIIYVDEPAGATPTTIPSSAGATSTGAHEDGGGHDSEHGGPERDD